ncbi:MAG: septum site-determining protein MinC [Marinagarivorans sp.]|nr:septum site-determining protein MinC [Marinagarivorans sp.]
MALKKAAVAMRPQSFAIKGALLPMTLLELKSLNRDEVRAELTLKVESSPDFFGGTPIVLSIDTLAGANDEFLSVILALCKQLGFRLAGIKGSEPWLADFAARLGLGLFPAGKGRVADEPDVALDVTSATAIDTVALSAAPKTIIEVRETIIEVPETTLVTPSKTITTPVRSGQQIYSEGDLIVLAPVSAGAEVLAVGNIHIYAPLRGRALAGVKGDESARIFCLSQEAELVSIAGHFMIDEILRKASWKSAAQIFFAHGELQVESLQMAIA